MSLRTTTWRMVDTMRDFLAYVLEALGLWSHDVDEMEELESTMEVALPSVKPSDRFRKRLRDDLSLAAKHRVSGLVVDYPRPLREAILLGLSAGVLTILVTVAVVIFYIHLVTSED